MLKMIRLCLPNAPSLLDHGVDRFHLFVDPRMAQVDDVNEKIGLDHFLERSLERLDQSVRQFSQKPDRIGQEHALFVRQKQTARRRIERREKFVLGQHAGAGEQIEQGRFAGVGIANDRGDRPLMTLPPLALNGAMLAHILQIALETRDPFLDAAAIDFELRFTGAARADAAGLAGKVRPHSR